EVSWSSDASRCRPSGIRLYWLVEWEKAESTSSAPFLETVRRRQIFDRNGHRVVSSPARPRAAVAGAGPGPLSDGSDRPLRRLRRPPRGFGSEGRRRGPTRRFRVLRSGRASLRASLANERG